MTPTKKACVAMPPASRVSTPLACAEGYSPPATTEQVEFFPAVTNKQVKEVILNLAKATETLLPNCHLSLWDHYHSPNPKKQAQEAIQAAYKVVEPLRPQDMAAFTLAAMGQEKIQRYPGTGPHQGPTPPSSSMNSSPRTPTCEQKSPLTGHREEHAKFATESAVNEPANTPTRPPFTTSCTIDGSIRVGANQETDKDGSIPVRAGFAASYTLDVPQDFDIDNGRLRHATASLPAEGTMAKPQAPESGNGHAKPPIHYDSQIPPVPASAVEHSPAVTSEQVKEVILNLAKATENLLPDCRLSLLEQYASPNPKKQAQEAIQDAYKVAESLKPQDMAAFSLAMEQEKIQRFPGTGDGHQPSGLPSSPNAPHQDDSDPTRPTLQSQVDLSALDEDINGPRHKVRGGVDSYLVQQLVTALEKLLASNSGKTTAAHDSDTEEGKDEKPDAVSTAESSTAWELKYEHVLECWDEKAGKYKIDKIADSKAKKLDQCIFVVRDKIERTSENIVSYIDIKSTLLRDVLRETFRDVRGVSLEDVTPSIERNALFHVREELNLRSKGYLENPHEADTKSHLDLLIGYLDNAFQPTAEYLSTLLAKRQITYDLLWALFAPNAEVYTTCPGTDAPRCVLFNHCVERRDMDGSKYMYLETRYLNANGEALGEVTTGIKIPYFPGPKPIEHLRAYPLQHHPEKEQVRRELVRCGCTFTSLMGIRHRFYEGKAFFIDDEGEIVARHIKSRIMIDATCFQQRMPNYPCPRVQKVRPKYSVMGRCDALQLSDIDPNKLEDTELLVCSPTVLGFCLSSKQFFEFAVANIRDIDWSPASFKDVQIPKKQKDTLWALTDDYLKREPDDGFRDLVQGKGQGVNFLLYGPPGVGKTLTAETIAESFKVPLYTVPAGQIGVDSVKVESVLRSIFKVASRWKVILLLDEADVFLSQRSDNPQSNALVSVFLRELEQYDGLLFLTTNRVQKFDEAMISRIHLALKYDPLDRRARKAVWTHFLAQARTKQGPPVLQEETLDDLSRKTLNGREIRNAVLIARATAEYQKTIIVEIHLYEAIGTREQFHCDFAGAAQIESLTHYG